MINQIVVYPIINAQKLELQKDTGQSLVGGCSSLKTLPPEGINASLAEQVHSYASELL